MTQLKLKENLLVTLKCGSAITKVHVLKSRETSSSQTWLELSSPAMDALKIPDNATLLIKPESPRVFRMGPVIGVLTFAGHVPNALKFYKAYARAARNCGMLYVFKGKSIDVQNQVIEGYYYSNRENRWIEASFPFPDAVIDKCYPNAYISHARLEKIIGKNKIFNKKTMIDKIDFRNALVNDPVLKTHLPKTDAFTDASQLTSMLKTFGEVFLKPLNGMKGLGIVTIKPARPGLSGTLECTYANHDQNISILINSPDEIHNILLKAAGRKRPYLIQQGIKRMEYKGGPFSIRSWAMKNGSGQWVIPGMFAKGSFGNSFLTNFTAGASLIPLQELLAYLIPLVPYTKESFMNLLKEITLKSAEVLDKKFGPLGELGFDIVFDNYGKPWIIEANGNPGVIPIFIQKEYPLWPVLLYKYPVDYAAHLAGF
ncbi:YheC/YheD family protein [Phosphitispora sp. TUW77]|uniref:YheC/YheD family endospore coat-associated protein n=1 Tax=Phosphitispora sp. TUW77 TaxID=3152361 RepID=UPI003AB2E1DD